jgi:hypothetical protein
MTRQEHASKCLRKALAGARHGVGPSHPYARAPFIEGKKMENAAQSRRSPINHAATRW